jgi:hypothetical protein
MRVLIHKIHAGEQLPSAEEGGLYYIVGFHRVFKTIQRAFPQDIRTARLTGSEGENFRTAPAGPPVRPVTMTWIQQLRKPPAGQRPISCLRRHVREVFDEHHCGVHTATLLRSDQRREF